MTTSLMLTVRDKFDVVGEITFSKRLGFLEEGRDVEGIMASIWQWFEYVAIVRLSLDYTPRSSLTPRRNEGRSNALARLVVGQK